MKCALPFAAAIVGSLAIGISAQAQRPPLNQSDFHVSGTVQSIDYSADCHNLTFPDTGAAGAFASALVGATGGCAADQKTYVAIKLSIVSSTDDDFKPGDTYMVNVVDPNAQSAVKSASGNAIGKTVRIYDKEAGFCPDSDSYILTNDTGSWLCTQ